MIKNEPWNTLLSHSITWDRVGKFYSLITVGYVAYNIILHIFTTFIYWKSEINITTARSLQVLLRMLMWTL